VRYPEILTRIVDQLIENHATDEHVTRFVDAWASLRSAEPLPCPCDGIGHLLVEVWEGGLVVVSCRSCGTTYSS